MSIKAALLFFLLNFQTCQTKRFHNESIKAMGLRGFSVCNYFVSSLNTALRLDEIFISG